MGLKNKKRKRLLLIHIKIIWIQEKTGSDAIIAYTYINRLDSDNKKNCSSVGSNTVY